jgi:hypothetical protein
VPTPLYPIFPHPLPPRQQLCTFPALASSEGDLVATLLRGCVDTVPNVRLVAAQFLAEVALAGGVPRDRIVSEVR